MATEILTIEMFLDLLQLSDFDLITIDLWDASQGSALFLIFKQVFQSPDICRFEARMCCSNERIRLALTSQFASHGQASRL